MSTDARTAEEWQVWSRIAKEWCPVTDGRTAAKMRRDAPEIITAVRVRQVGEWRNPEAHQNGGTP